MSLKYSSKKKIKFSKNKTKYRKSKISLRKSIKNKKIKGGSFGGGSYGYTLQQMPIDMATRVYIQQMISTGYYPHDLIYLIEDFVEQMRIMGYDPHVARMIYTHEIASMMMGPPMGAMMGPPMGAMMGPPPMGAMMGPPPMGSASLQMTPPPPPPALERHNSDSVLLFVQLRSTPFRKQTMNEAMELMKDYTFGSDKVVLSEGRDIHKKPNGFINETSKGNYFNWTHTNKDGKIVQKCHLSLHNSQSIDSVGTLHVRDDQTKGADKKKQSIKININNPRQRHYDISIEDDTDPPNPRLKQFAEDIVRVFIRYYNLNGETATFVR